MRTAKLAVLLLCVVAYVSSVDLEHVRRGHGDGDGTKDAGTKGSRWKSSGTRTRTLRAVSVPAVHMHQATDATAFESLVEGLELHHLMHGGHFLKTNFPRITEANSGMVARHIQAFQEVANEQKAIIVVRKNEETSRALIAQGYTTKAMDIHDKSSNWGLMRGFVPLDPFFSKKNKDLDKASASPSADILRDRKEAIDHALEADRTRPVRSFITPTQLALTDGVLQLALDNGAVTRIDGKYAGRNDWKTKYPRYLTALDKCNGANQQAYGVVCPLGAPCYVLFCVTTTKSGTSPHLISFFHSSLQSDAFVPLQVWAYRESESAHPVPVTGDYDLYMVAPHIDNVQDFLQYTSPGTLNSLVDAMGSEPNFFKSPETNYASSLAALKSAIREMYIRRSVSVKGGTSDMTSFNKGLNNLLNGRCKEKLPITKDVVLHGPETLNLDFVQPLDQTFTVFVPTLSSVGIDESHPYNWLRSGVADVKKFPYVLALLLRQGFLVSPNVRYIDRDIAFSGKFDDSANSAHQHIRVQTMFSTFYVNTRIPDFEPDAGTGLWGMTRAQYEAFHQLFETMYLQEYEVQARRQKLAEGKTTKTFVELMNLDTNYIEAKLYLCAVTEPEGRFADRFGKFCGKQLQEPPFKDESSTLTKRALKTLFGNLETRKPDLSKMHENIKPAREKLIAALRGKGRRVFTEAELEGVLPRPNESPTAFEALESGNYEEFQHERGPAKRQKRRGSDP